MSQLVDQLAKLAAQADAPPLDDTAARRMIDAALVRATLAEPRPEPRRHRAWIPTLALASAAVIAALALRPRTPAEPALMHVALPTGDQLSGTAGARFDIDELTPASRRLHLHAGTMVFDVAHVVPGQHFEVATHDATIVATGTVFSVATDARGTHVHVFEGSVAVRSAAGESSVVAGGDWQTAALADSPQIVEAGMAAARERARIAVAPPPPAVAAALAPVPVPAAPAAPVPAPAPIRHPVVARVAAPAPAPAPAALEPPAAPPASDPLADARADVAAARFADALAKSDAAPHPLTGAWLLLRADALRGLDKKHDAADALVAAAARLEGTEQTEAAYSAAYLRFHDLKDADGALAALAAADVDVAGSMFEERGLALHVEILVAQDKRAEARPLAQRYLEHFPRGELRSLMSQVVKK